MKIKWIGILLGLSSAFAWSQNTADLEDIRYVEDQFYAGITYNFVFNLPKDINQNNFSYGLQIGFIKDFPVNYQRNFAIGLGIGYAYNNYYHNLRAQEVDGKMQFAVVASDIRFKRNKFESQLIEIPLEFRWRSKKNIEWDQTKPDSYKFWRVYTGFRLGYAIRNRAKFITDANKEVLKLPEMNTWKYGLTLSMGYNNWNFYAYYGLNDLFEKGTKTVNGENMTMRPLRVGLLFYIL
ncbi:MAG: PorT family protein [Flavobacteriaceae bacterium]|nr:PorT family protein [Flavobacteriaceae bacterium]